MATQLKSRMKKEDPNDFSIHDFLGECKTTEAASSRFDEENVAPTYEFAATKGSLDPLYETVSSALVERGWHKRKDDTGRYHLILGNKQGKNIPFKRFAQLFKWDYGITPHCNFYRGGDAVTNKSHLLLNIRKHILEQENEEDSRTEKDIFASIFPASFLFFPSKPDESDLEQFTQQYEMNAKRGLKNFWMVEPIWDGHAAKSKSFVTDNYDEVVDHVQMTDATSDEPLPYSFVVEEYFEDPLLLNKDSKFEYSVFVLLDHQYGIHRAPQGVIETCKKPFSLSNTEAARHIVKRLTHGEKAEISPEFFAKWLSSEKDGRLSAIDDQCNEKIVTTLQALKKALQYVEHADFTAFQLFKFRFSIRSDMSAWLVGVDPAPVVPRDQMKDIANGVVELGINPLFQSGNKKISSSSFVTLQKGKSSEERVLAPQRSNKK